MLELQDLTRTFGDKVALEDLTFSVAEGALHGFVGRNGAGKTTTMRIILGVLAADRGSVRWRGQQVDRELRSRFGYMPEERGLYPKMTVASQLAYFAQLHGIEAVDARQRAGELLERLGLSERAGDPVEDLSLGNQQRVQLGVALIHNPEVLVLDEPFSGLDPTGVDVLTDVLTERVRGGTAVLFSSHQLELVERLCDAVAIIDGGRLVAEGPVEDLRRAQARDRWIVELDGDPREGWADALPGTVVTVAGARAEIELDGDGQGLLAAAQGAGPIKHFARHEPPLAELFRDAVDQPVAA